MYYMNYEKIIENIENVILGEINFKKVRFSNHIKVVLVPNRTEIYQAGITDVLWWCQHDYDRFLYFAQYDMSAREQMLKKSFVHE